MRRSTPFELLQSQLFRSTQRIIGFEEERLIRQYAWRRITPAKISQKTRRRRAHWS